MCPCCAGALHRIGEDVNDVVDRVPAVLRILRTIRPKYACRACEGAVVQARARPRLIESGMASTALVAWIASAKFAWGSLIEDLELAVFERLAQILLKLAAHASLLVHLRFEDAPAARRLRLGPIEREVGGDQQILGARPVARRHRDADARADENGLFLEEEGFGEPSDEAAGQPRRVFGVKHWSGPLGADRDQAAELTVCRAWWSSNCWGLR